MAQIFTVGLAAYALGMAAGLFGLSTDWSLASVLISLLWFGAKLLALAAAVALVLVLQILMVAQKSLVTNIRGFGVQSFLLASIAAAIA